MKPAIRSVTKPTRPNAKHAESRFSAPAARRSRSQTPAPNTSHSVTAAVLRSIATISVVRSAAMRAAISADVDPVAGNSHMSGMVPPAVPSTMLIKPAPPATFIMSRSESVIGRIVPPADRVVDYPGVME